MSSTVITNFQFIFDAALAEYREHTGVDLSQYPFAEKLQSCQSADDILELLQDKAKKFNDYRNGDRKLINCLEPVVQVLHAYSGVASLVRASSLASDHLFTPSRPGAVPTNKCNIFWRRCSPRRMYLRCFI